MISITNTEHDIATANLSLSVTSPVSVTKPSRSQKLSPVVHSWLEDPFNAARGEMAMWIAVITQAMMDALSKSRHPEHRYHKHAAIQWLTGNSKDFILVCMLAGFDPDYVRRKAKRALVSPTAWRAKPGQGRRYQERRAYRQRLKKEKSMTEKASDTLSRPAVSAEIIVGPWRV